MSDYRIKSKIEYDETADIVNNIKIGSIIGAGFLTVVVGVCTWLLKTKVEEIPEPEYEDEYDDEYDTEYEEE